MRTLFKFSIVFPLALLSCGAPSIDTDTLIANVNVIDVERGRVIPNQHVALQDGRIIKIASEGKYKFDAKNSIDGSNKYLIPGLWDMHVHIREYQDLFFPLFIANGVTGIRDMFNPSMEDLGKWKSEVNTSKKLSPKLISVASNIVDAPPLVWSGTEILNDPDSAKALVKRMKAKGADFIKVYDKLPQRTYTSLLEECKQHGIPIAGHVPDVVGIQDVIRGGQSSIEHLDDFTLNLSYNYDEYQTKLKEAINEMSFIQYRALKQQLSAQSFGERDEKKVEEVMTLLKEYGCWPSTSIFNIFHQLTNRPFQALNPEDFGLQYYPDSLAQRYRSGLQKPFPKPLQSNLSTLMRAKLKLLEDFERFDVPFLVGTDASPIRAVVPGVSLHRELELMGEADISPMTLLKSATIYPAVFMGMQNDYGGVEENKIADLVLLSKNPLEDISNTSTIEAVFLNGQYLSKVELHKTLENLKEKAGKK